MFDSELYIQASEKVPQKYLLANLVSMRIRQLSEGADPLVEHEGLSYINIALKEISEEMIRPRTKDEEITTGEELFA